MNWLVLVTSILALASYASPWPLYHGNQDLLQYLKVVCGYSKHTALTLVLVEKPLVHSRHHNANRNTSILAHLQDIHCHFDHYTQESVLYLQRVTQDSKYHFRSIMMVFDLTAEEMEEAHFNEHLSSLSDLYKQCDNCEPFLIVLDTNHQNLIEWTKRIFGRLQEHFRSILVATQSRPPKATVYIRPVLNGCHQYSGIFYPVRKKEYDLLRKVDSSYCDLNSSTINIIINEVRIRVQEVSIALWGFSFSGKTHLSHFLFSNLYNFF